MQAQDDGFARSSGGGARGTTNAPSEHRTTSGATSTEQQRAEQQRQMDPQRATPAPGTRAPDRSEVIAERSAPPPVIMSKNEAVTGRRDRIRWSAVWAGVIVSIAIYLLMQLALVATGAIDLGVADRNDAWLSAGAALLAFLIGGMTTGASAIWDKIEDGILHGIVMWALGVVAILTLSVVAGGLTLGALDATGAFEDITVDLEEGTVDGVETALGAEDAEEAASWVLLGLAAALLAVVLGSIAGTMIWPRQEEIELNPGDQVSPR
jgi:cation transport ATPase